MIHVGPIFVPNNGGYTRDNNIRERARSRRNRHNTYLPSRCH